MKEFPGYSHMYSQKGMVFLNLKLNNLIRAFLRSYNFSLHAQIGYYWKITFFNFFYISGKLFLRWIWKLPSFNVCLQGYFQYLHKPSTLLEVGGKKVNSKVSKKWVNIKCRRRKKMSFLYSVNTLMSNCFLEWLFRKINLSQRSFLL